MTVINATPRTTPSVSAPPADNLQQTTAMLAQICAAKGVHHFVISPGSRSAPLTIAIARHPAIQTYVIYDERSAAYVALGMAQQLGQPVGLICTSGTAALNYAPAVTEAFYQGIPLLVFTADRPPEWIDQQDNQAIHQRGLYEPHCRGSYELPVDTNHRDARWFVERIIAQAIDRCLYPVPGPVHINAPFREPLYPADGQMPPPSLVNPIQMAPVQPQLTEAGWAELVALWQTAERKLIIGGMHASDARLHDTLRALGADPTVAVIGDITANLYPHASDLHQADMVLGVRDPATVEQLRPDLVVTFGGQYVSKYLRALLRQHPPRHQWHLQIADDTVDTLQCLTHTIPMHAAEFFTSLRARTQPKRDGAYASFWQHLQTKAAGALATFLDQAPFGEFQAIQRVMQALPADSRLQIGNSMPIRYANFISYQAGNTLAQINSNRGTSGIDGTVSTAVGAALATGELTTLIVGDLAFFYDRNGLWHAQVPPNLRIVILNNHGGGIFQIIDGPKRLPEPELATYFLTPQPLTAKRTAEDHNCDYYAVNSEAALSSILPEFFSSRPCAAILEIETDMQLNTQVFDQFRSLVAGLSM